MKRNRKNEVEATSIGGNERRVSQNSMREFCSDS
jgi:hypothetical protein